MAFLTKILRFVVASIFIALCVAIFATAALVIFNVKFEWFPEGYISFIDQTRADYTALVLLGLSVLLFASLLRDLFRSRSLRMLTEEQLPTNLFYKISGDITEDNGRIVANLDVFGNINGSNKIAKIIASIKKDKFPFFMLREKDEGKKIFAGSYMKIKYSKITNY